MGASQAASTLLDVNIAAMKRAGKADRRWPSWKKSAAR